MGARKSLSRSRSLSLAFGGGSHAKPANQIKESAPWLRGAGRSLSRTRFVGYFERRQRSSRAFSRRAYPRRFPPRVLSSPGEAVAHRFHIEPCMFQLYSVLSCIFHEGTTATFQFNHMSSTHATKQNLTDLCLATMSSNPVI